MLRLLISLSLLACTGCSFMRSGPEVVMEKKDDNFIFTLPSGNVIELQSKPGYWTNVDPETGEVTQVPFEEMGL